MRNEMQHGMRGKDAASVDDIGIAGNAIVVAVAIDATGAQGNREKGRHKTGGAVAAGFDRQWPFGGAPWKT